MFQTISIFAFLATALFTLANYLLFSRSQPSPNPNPNPNLKTSTRFERALYFLLALSILLLTLTSFLSLFLYGALAGWLLFSHMFAAGLFIICLPLASLRWASENSFAPSDWLWLTTGGCCCQRDAHFLLTSRFNGTQKVLFWLGLLLALTSLATILLSMLPLFGTGAQLTLIVIHKYAALFLVNIFVVYVYQSLVVQKRFARLENGDSLCELNSKSEVN